MFKIYLGGVILPHPNYLTYTKKHNWETVNKYNNTYHSTGKLRPVNVKSNTYIKSGKDINNKDPKFKFGDIVRVQNIKILLRNAMLQIALKKFYD